eukprot:1426408-Prymnesium_polylepis.1
MVGGGRLKNNVLHSLRARRVGLRVGGGGLCAAALTHLGVSVYMCTSMPALSQSLLLFGHKRHRPLVWHEPVELVGRQAAPLAGPLSTTASRRPVHDE